MDRYQVAESEHGPWMELVVTNNPRQALAKARASFGWKTVFVALMRPIRGVDLLPSPAVFWSDVSELVAVRYGSSVIDELETSMSMDSFDDVEVALTGMLLDCGVEILVPDKIRWYGPDQEVRAIDFVKDEAGLRRPRVKLADILS